MYIGVWLSLSSLKRHHLGLKDVIVLTFSPAPSFSLLPSLPFIPSSLFLLSFLLSLSSSCFRSHSFLQPHVNPTIPTWGTDDDGRSPYTLSNATLKGSGCKFPFLYERCVCTAADAMCVLTCYTVVDVGADNAVSSPDYFIDYADPKGPNESHKWLQSHPFY